MCGRYALSRGLDDLVEEFRIDQVVVTEALAPDYNVAPTKRVYAVLECQPDQDDGGGGATADAPVRQLRVVRWGLVPFWAKDPAIGNRLINARVETVAEKPAFRRAFVGRRCLLPADGYYEWYTPQEASAAGRRKQPFFIRPKDGGILAMAGLYELWCDPSRPADDPDRWRWTCTVLTTRAEDSLGRIHDRMPLLVEPDRWDVWLDPRRRDPDELRALLAPAAPGRLAAYPVSTAVNDVRNNGPHLIEPLPPEPDSGVENPEGRGGLLF
ncbi:hypothetical protein TH66_09785 [Carbonactinospora thermoautotrophica]|uniref:Abasic site processing protein n=2 Tax=Carbonactinospora thermoautotrophica TaxID=1469144 RepID=A0A132N3K9_9ACTN|nr:SOS response-associated peptidase [Carbonactinospora thermoautotrophica]KWX04172.1 hypothetical protein TH66_09785 [Carbonactinospora thermoautotrophica]